MLRKLIIVVVSIAVLSTATKVYAEEAQPYKESVATVFQGFQEWIGNLDFQWDTAEFKENLRELSNSLAQLSAALFEEISSDEEPPPKVETQSEVETDITEFEEEVVTLVNEERTAEGLDPLEMHQRLSELAEVKSQDMADENYFSHTSPTYGSPFDMMDQFDFEYRAAGENIAAGQRTPEEVVEGWMNSEGHRENILNDTFTHIGVGYVEGGSYRTYWTQLFMTPY
ncbi:hypothetical protein EQV77_07485 [Halobacillus fulvus]|nr:hypothetical protein EQV77_07485 [Halobacillus fulvus]